MIDPVSLLVGGAGVLLFALLVIAAVGLYVSGKYAERDNDKVVHIDDVRTAREVEDTALDRRAAAHEMDRRQRLDETATEEAEAKIRRD